MCDYLHMSLWDNVSICLCLCLFALYICQCIQQIQMQEGMFCTSVSRRVCTS